MITSQSVWLSRIILLGLSWAYFPQAPAKTLWVTVQVGPEGDLRQIVERGLDRMSEIVAEKFTESHEGEIFAVCFNGLMTKVLPMLCQYRWR